jgi:hypothetical protein
LPYEQSLHLFCGRRVPRLSRYGMGPSRTFALYHRLARVRLMQHGSAYMQIRSSNRRIRDNCGIAGASGQLQLNHRFFAQHQVPVSTGFLFPPIPFRHARMCR